MFFFKYGPSVIEGSMFSNERINVDQLRMHYIELIEQCFLQESGPKLVKVNLTIKGQS